MIASQPAKYDRRRDRPDSGGATRYADITVPAGLVIYADGCCEPNPGAGGWGFVVYRDGAEVHCASGGDLEATNQRMELTAALQALLWVANAGDVTANVRLISDSKYTVTGCNEWRHNWKRRGWRRKSAEAAEKNQVVANLDLWKLLDAALTATPVNLEWVKGHCGVIGNERADELSLIGRDAALEEQPPTDLIRQQLRGIA
ncbi:ribonuclease HI [Mesorhizobium sp. M1060]|uniref:ribonuclease H family protein n=1 Tax=Mesorhizobium sp. M1060 TaxID=2957052 RepID=UPI0033350294